MIEDEFLLLENIEWKPGCLARFFCYKKQLNNQLFPLFCNDLKHIQLLTQKP